MSDGVSSNTTVAYDKLTVDLLIIAKLQPGETISTPNVTIVNRHNWTSWLYRRITRETKHSTINFIENIFHKAVEHLENNKNFTEIATVSEALRGFAVLKDTYSDDELLCGKISRVINEMDARLQVCSRVFAREQIMEQLLADQNERLKQERLEQEKLEREKDEAEAYEKFLVTESLNNDKSRNASEAYFREGTESEDSILSISPLNSNLVNVFATLSSSPPLAITNNRVMNGQNGPNGLNKKYPQRRPWRRTMKYI